jgi:hypothetical protein
MNQNSSWFKYVSFENRFNLRYLKRLPEFMCLELSNQNESVLNDVSAIDFQVQVLEGWRLSRVWNEQSLENMIQI